MKSALKLQEPAKKSKRTPLTPPADMPKAVVPLFKKLGEHLRDLGLLERRDIPMLSSYCRYQWLLNQAQAQVEAEGIVVHAAHGVKPHPAIAASTQFSGSMAKLSSQLGIGASARKRIAAEAAKAGKEDSGSPWVSNK